jgi:LysR family transcriptional regulator, low CO2-responsive transcriptional regulator
MRHSRIRRYLRHGTLPQLAVFEASARLGSFSGASRELHLAQPTVSAQMRKLAETVGAPLFTQIGKQIHLTVAGRRLHARCADLFGVLDALERDLAAVRDLRAGYLTLCASGACEQFAARQLAQFGEAHPGIEVALHVGNREQIVQRLTAGMDDLYLLANPPADIPLVRQSVVANPYVVVAAPDDPLAGGRDLAFGRIAERAFVLRERGSGTRMITDRIFAAHGLVPRARMTLSSQHAVRAAVRAGDGLAIVPLRSFGPDVERDGLAVLDVDGFPLPAEWQLAYPVGSALSPAAQAFLDHIREESLRLRASPSRERVQDRRRPVRCSLAADAWRPTA